MITSMIIILAIAVGILTGYYLEKKEVQKDLKAAKANSIRIKQENDEKINELTNDIITRSKQNTETYQNEEIDVLDEQVDENRNREKRAELREHNLDTSNERLQKSESVLADKQQVNANLRKSIAQSGEEVNELNQQRKEILTSRSNMLPEQAKQLVLSSLQADLKRDQDKLIKYNHDTELLSAPKQAANLMIESLQQGPINVPRSRIERSVEITDAGQRDKISGKNDQRLRLIETLTGVDLIFDPERPEMLIISTSDPAKREITRSAITNLLKIKNLTNNVIATEIEKAQKKIMDGFRETGENTTNTLRLGWVHPDMIKVLGRLKYRTSYGQNVLQHSIEVAQISGVIAAELGLNVTIAKRAGLFHDIGKAIDREVGGTHVELGVELATTYGEDPVVINSIASHHGDVEADNPIAVIVAIADGMSGARPGARSESVEEYINRLKNLERIADNHPGVKTSYAIQAGREIRIIVDPNKVDDNQSDQLTNEVADQIEDELTYPGKIKVTTIRKLQAVQYVGGKPKKNSKKKNNA